MENLKKMQLRCSKVVDVDEEEVEVVLELRVIEVDEVERPNNRCLRWQPLDLALPAPRVNMTAGIYTA
jgi:hypothetical protein